MQTITLARPFGQFVKREPIIVPLATINQELGAALSIAKRLGVSGAGAVAKAVQAVKCSTGTDLTKLFNVADFSGVIPMPCYGAGELAALIGGTGMTSRRVNKLLVEKGLQREILRRPYANRGSKERVVGYELTDDGRKYAVVGKNGRMYIRTFKWRKEVIEIIGATN